MFTLPDMNKLLAVLSMHYLALRDLQKIKGLKDKVKRYQFIIIFQYYC